MHRLAEPIKELRNGGVRFSLVSDGVVATTSPSDNMIVHIFSTLAKAVD